MNEEEENKITANPFERSLSLAIGGWYGRTILGFIGGLLLAIALQNGYFIVIGTSEPEFRLIQVLLFGIPGAILFIIFLKLERTSRDNPNYWSKERQ